MGEYTVTPQAVISTDINSWAANYTANVEYSIASGPTTTSISASTASLTSTAPTLPIFQGSTTSLEPGWNLQPVTYNYPAGSAGVPASDGGWANVTSLSGSSASYTFSVAARRYTTIVYGIPAGGYQNNSPANIYINGNLQSTSSVDVGGDGTKATTQEDLWSETFGPGTYRLTFTGSINVYGLWASNPSAITPQ